MKIIEKNEGTKIPYEFMKSKVIFNDELMINLEKYERDHEMHLDICTDEYGCLAMGLANNYVAQIDIPAREYDYVQNGVDEEGRPNIEKVAHPFDVKGITLTLWAVEG